MNTNKCGFCEHQAQSRIELENHVLNFHSPHTRTFVCICGEQFEREEQLTFHRYHRCEQVNPPVPIVNSSASEPSTPGKKKRKKRVNHVTAFSQHLRSGFAFTYRLPDGSSPPRDTDPFELLELEGEENNLDPLHMAPRGEAEISSAVEQALLETAGNLKIYLTSVVWLQRATPGANNAEVQNIAFPTAGRSFIVQNMESYRAHYQAEMARMVNLIHDFQENGSGWRLRYHVGISYNLALYKPIGGGSYIPTPKSLVSKRAVINLVNLYDDKCLVYAIATALYLYENPQAHHPRRVNNIPQKYIEQVPVEGLKAPYFVQELTVLEQRDSRLALNCFSVHADDGVKDIVPIRISEHNYQTGKIMVNLLLLYDGKGRYHYTLITNFDRLMCGATGKKSTGKMCVNCQHTVHGINRWQRFQDHVMHCKAPLTLGRLTFPKGPIQFDRVATKNRKGFVVYADFESALSPTSPPSSPTQAQAPPPHIPTQISHKTAMFQDLIQQFAFPDFASNNSTTTSSSPPEFVDFDGVGSGGAAQATGASLAKPQSTSGTQHILSHHSLLAYTLVVISPKPKYDAVFSYSDVGEDQVKERLVHDLYCIKRMIEDYYADHVESAIGMKPLTPQQEAEHKAATHCYVCDLPFLTFASAGVSFDKYSRLRSQHLLQSRNPHDTDTYVPLALTKGIKVRDHDHDTGKYRGPCHSLCNLHLKNLIKTPVLFHNGSKYDYHLLLTTLAAQSKQLEKKNIEVIGKTMERFTTLEWENFEFKDSYNFLQTSLDQMVANLKTTSLAGSPPCRVFKHTLRHFANVYPEVDQTKREELLLRKGVMCYEHLSDAKVLLETRLPPRQAFASVLRGGETVSLEDYQHACTVWHTFQMKSMRDYLDLYCTLDTLLLADCFEEFRNMSMASYTLDPVHFHTAPSLAWSAALSTTGIQLEVIKDVEMLTFLNRGLLGGYSAVHHHYALANNPSMGEAYDDSQPCSTCVCLDANNLYGW